MSLGGGELESPFSSRHHIYRQIAEVLVAFVHVCLILQVKEDIWLVCKTNRESECHNIGTEVTFRHSSAVSHWGEFHPPGEQCFQGAVVAKRSCRLLYTFLIDKVIMCIPLTYHIFLFVALDYLQSNILFKVRKQGKGSQRDKVQVTWEAQLNNLIIAEISKTII